MRSSVSLIISINIALVILRATLFVPYLHNLCSLNYGCRHVPRSLATPSLFSLEFGQIPAVIIRFRYILNTSSQFVSLGLLFYFGYHTLLFWYLAVSSICPLLNKKSLAMRAGPSSLYVGLTTLYYKSSTLLQNVIQGHRLRWILGIV